MVSSGLSLRPSNLSRDPTRTRKESCKEKEGHIPIKHLERQLITLNSTLAKLPTEIILDILGHLTIRNDDEVNLDNDTSNSDMWLGLKALSRVSQTCRVLSNMATPLLYQSFIKPHSDDENGHLNRTNHLGCFLRTVVSNPELGALVKRIYIGRFEMGLYTRPHNHGPHLNHPPLMEPLRRAMRHLTLYQHHEPWMRNLVGLGRWNRDEHGEPRWDWTFRPGVEDAEILLLLGVLRNVSEVTLHLPEPYEPDSETRAWSAEHLCFAILALYARGPNSTVGSGWLPHLRKATIYCWVDPNLENDFFYHGLSGLIQGSTAGQPSASDALSSLSQDQESHLTSECDLVLNECILTGAPLANLLRQCGRITSLNLHFIDENPNAAIGQPGQINEAMTWRAIARGLRFQASHLRTLVLDSSCQESRLMTLDDDESNRGSRLGSLAHLTALRELRVCEPGLLGPPWWQNRGNLANSDPEPEEEAEAEAEYETAAVDLLGLLPPNLESLTLTGCTSFGVTQLQEAVSRLPGGLPSLRRVGFEMSADSDWRAWRRLDSLDGRVQLLRKSLEEIGMGE